MLAGRRQRPGRRKRPRKNEALQGARSPGTMRRHARSVRAAALSIFFGALVFMSLVVDDGKTPALPVIGGRRMMFRVDGERRTMKDAKAEDPFQDSKRRVPNGPDPIHNRYCNLRFSAMQALILVFEMVSFRCHSRFATSGKKLLLSLFTIFEKKKNYLCSLLISVLEL